MQVYKGCAYDPFDMHAWRLHGAAVHAYDHFFGYTASLALALGQHEHRDQAAQISMTATCLACLLHSPLMLICVHQRPQTVPPSAARWCAGSRVDPPIPQPHRCACS